MGSRLLTPEEVAARLQISRLTVMAYLRSGVLKGIKVGRLWRVEEDDLQAFLTSGPDRPDGAFVAADGDPRPSSAEKAANSTYRREQQVSFATDEPATGRIDAGISGDLPEWDWGPGGKPPGKPVRYVPGVGIVIEGGKSRGE